MTFEHTNTRNPPNDAIVAAANALKLLADLLAEMLDGRVIVAKTPTEQLLGRQLVYARTRAAEEASYRAGSPIQDRPDTNLARGPELLVAALETHGIRPLRH